MQTKKFFTVQQFCKYVGEDIFTAAAVYEQIKNGNIPVQQLGSKILIPTAWVEDFVNGAKCKKVAN
ncbi:MAG: hypothetical protein J5987_03240 [Phascolarctobacterium sp.]|nr:hypothetical protein [Phascolarctobacterium sp.]